MNTQAIIDVPEEFVSKNKQAHIDRVLRFRTRHLTLVFEDIDKPHNVSAILRTAECMGIQDSHFIKNRNSYSVNPEITQGAARWVTLHHYNQSDDNTVRCFDSLRKNGYKIYATLLHETSHSIYDLDPTHKTAIVSGTEVDSITQEVGGKADGLVHIPMRGFTGSFNLSVSAAICLTVLKSGLDCWPHISEEEKPDLRAEWYRKIVREADLILKSKGVAYE